MYSSFTLFYFWYFYFILFYIIVIIKGVLFSILSYMGAEASGW